MPSRGRLGQRLAWAAGGALAGLLLLAAVLRGLALDTSPVLRAEPVPVAASMAQIRSWLRRQDPRRTPDGSERVLRASVRELQLLGGQAARLAGGSARLSVSGDGLQVQASLPLAGRWANVALTLAEGAPLPHLARFQLGALVLPGWLADPLARAALWWWDRPPDGRPPLRALVQRVQFGDDGLRLHYRWSADVPLRLTAWLLPPAQVARLRHYQTVLVEAAGAERRPRPLVALLTPLFQLAQQRSDGASAADAAAENRAALLVLASHLSGRPLASWLPAASDWPRVWLQPVLLGGRTDFAVHLLVSAVLAAEAGGPVADALGLAKELGDSRGGSGFSFNDLAINRTGARLGEAAVQDPLRLQRRLAAGVDESALLPEVADLPEFLSEAAFTARYGGVGSAAYEALTARIEARVAAMPLWQ